LKTIVLGTAFGREDGKIQEIKGELKVRSEIRANFKKDLTNNK